MVNYRPIPFEELPDEALPQQRGRRWRHVGLRGDRVGVLAGGVPQPMAEATRISLSDAPLVDAGLGTLPDGRHAHCHSGASIARFSTDQIDSRQWEKILPFFDALDVISTVRLYKWRAAPWARSARRVAPHPTSGSPSSSLSSVIG